MNLSDLTVPIIVCECIGVNNSVHASLVTIW